ncbi:MAG: FtsQ-type POTRA domain-containing protein [Bacteriovoracaceae bacterium]|nr:FtsQ-type POTRA domain-containing protein [Bacteroidota bacterium]
MVNEESIEIDQSEEEQPSHGKRVYVYGTLLMAFLLSIFVVKANWQHHVPVKQVTVEGISVISKDEIVRLMNLPPNVPMYEVDLTAAQKNILSNSFVKNVVIQRDAPSALRVLVEERKPAAILNANELYYLTSDGTVLPYIASAEAYDIPVISGMDSLTGITAGQRLLNADIREALEIITASKYTSEHLFHAISEIRLRKGRDLVLYSFESGIPIIFGKGDAVRKLVKLEAFWQQFLQNNATSDIQYIDIRFDDQVVVSRKNS